MQHSSAHRSAGPRSPRQRPTLVQDVRAPAPEGAPPSALPRAASVSHDDVVAVACAARARLTDPRAERERDAALSELYGAALHLARCLGDHTRHSLVEYRGSHSAWDVVREGEELFTAHERYAAAARRAADRLRALGLTPVFAE